MAILGGLLRGTTGAFVRGSLDTATNIVQATAERDAEKIENKVKGFGAKYNAYNEALKEFTDESTLIDEVAATLRNQNDPNFKDFRDEDYQGYAQELIKITPGQNVNTGTVIKYYTENKNKLEPIINLPTLTQPKADATTEQTDAVLGTAPPEPTGFASALAKAFSGASAQEIEERTASELGISVSEFRRVQAGEIPKRPRSNVAIKINGNSPYKKLVDDRFSRTLEVASKQEFLGRQDIKLPNGNVVNGQEFLSTMLEVHDRFSLNQKDADGQMLMKMQNFVLTELMPPNAKGLFAQQYGKAIDAIDAGISNPNIAPEDRRELELIHASLVTQMYNAATVPNYENDSKNLEQVSNLVVHGRRILATARDPQSGESLALKVTKTAVNDILSKRDSTSYSIKDGSYNGETYLNVMNNLRNRLIAAGDNQGELQKIMNDIMFLQNNAFSLADKPASSSEDLIAADMAMLKSMSGQPGIPNYAGMSDEALRNAAISFRANNKGGYKLANGVPQMIIENEGRVTVVPMPSFIADRGFYLPISQEAYRDQMGKLQQNSSTMVTLAQITNTAFDNPLMFTIFGDAAIGGQTYADIADVFVKEGLAEAYNQTFNVSEIAEARRNAISLVSTAKDRLFDDPRLSDQDLKLVLQYIAILEGGGLGKGSTQALAALAGLQVAIMKDTAFRQYSITPQDDRKVYSAYRMETGQSGPFNKTGELIIGDGTIEAALYNQLFTAYGVPKLSLADTEKLRLSNDPKDQKLFAEVNQKYEMFSKMVDAALVDLASYQALGYRAPSNKSNLMKMGDVNDDGVLIVKDGLTGLDSKYNVMSLAQAKMQYGSTG